MPTTRSRGLSTADLDSLRTAVEAGRKPKVQFTSAAGQVAGQIGQVVRFDDPSADEWVVVRFGRDELPFAPADLQLAPKAPPRQKAVPKAAVAPSEPAAASGGAASGGPGVSGSPVGGSQVSGSVEGANGAAPVVAAAASTATRPVTAAATPAEAAASAKPAAAGLSAKPAAAGGSTKPTAAAASAKAAPAATASTPGDAGGAAKPRPARKGAPKKAPDLTVSLTHHEGHWTVSAARGARVLVKPTSVRAADALRMVTLLESPAVADAVDEIVSAARADAEEQAERLRQQLAEVEAALADLSDPE